MLNIDYMPGTEGAEMSKCRACPQEAQGWEWGEGIKASQQSQCRAMSAVTQEAQDTVGIDLVGKLQTPARLEQKRDLLEDITQPWESLERLKKQA